MNCYCVLQDKSIIPLIGAVSYSTGDGLELTSRYGYDYSKRPQSLTFRRRNTALTLTAQIAFNPVLCAENNLVMNDYISDLEHLCGEKVDLFWNKRNVGSFVVQSVQFSGSVDHISLISQMAVSLSMIEGFVKRENLTTIVNTL